MDGFDVIGVAIGLVFVYLLLSLACAAIQETLAAFLDWRARDLYLGINQLLQDPNLAKKVYDHPLIKGLYKYKNPAKSRVGNYLTRATEWTNTTILGQVEFPGKQDLEIDLFPTYIPAKLFASALLGTVANLTLPGGGASVNPSFSLTPAELEKQLKTSTPEIQRIFQVMFGPGEKNMAILQQNIEEWFNNSMDSVSGWYRRRSQYLLFWVGLGLSVAMNVNTISIAQALYNDDELRAVVVDRAKTFNTGNTLPVISLDDVKKELNSLHLPIGWGEEAKPASIPMAILGWLITALAVTLGAPFWFDLLNKFIVIRSTVKPHEKSLPEGSEDRRLQPS